MRGMPLSLQLCPGLARLWCEGDVVALGHSFAFAGLFNTLVLSTFLWPELLDTGFRWLGAASLITWWLLGVWWNRQFLVQWRCPSQEDAPELTARLQEAQLCYLRHDWTAAEALVRKNLHESPRDLEAGLLLAQILRRREQYERAIEQLSRLQILDESLQWQLEISRELSLVQNELEADGLEPEMEGDEPHSRIEPPDDPGDDAQLEGPAELPAAQAKAA